MKSIVILGSTGSVGKNALQVLRDQPGRFRVLGLCAQRSGDLILEQAAEFGVKDVCLTDPDAARELAMRAKGQGLRIHKKPEDLVGLEGVQLVVGAIVGAAGMRASLETVRLGRDLALANKETLVMAGDVVMREARRTGARILPVDSEHSALWQCLWGSRPEDVEELILTASGGPFRGRSRASLENVSREEALNHPTWKMGPKITVDSATLMNKGLEVIEARHLFGVGLDRVKVLVHPQSLVHSLVQFRDGSMLAQLGTADMKVPIQVALDYPERHKNSYARLDLAAAAKLTFEKPDLGAFPCLGLAYEAARKGGVAEAVLNAANEQAVEAFLGGRCRFMDIPRFIEETLGSCAAIKDPSLDDLVEADAWARRQVASRAGGSLKAV